MDETNGRILTSSHVWIQQGSIEHCGMFGVDPAVVPTAPPTRPRMGANRTRQFHSLMWIAFDFRALTVFAPIVSAPNSRILLSSKLIGNFNSDRCCYQGSSRIAQIPFCVLVPRACLQFDKDCWAILCRGLWQSFLKITVQFPATCFCIPLDPGRSCCGPGVLRIGQTSLSESERGEGWVRGRREEGAKRLFGLELWNDGGSDWIWLENIRGSFRRRRPEIL